MLLARESAASLEWFEDLGVPFSGPYLEPPHQLPRMYNVIPHARVYITRLEKAARRLGVEIVLGAGETVLIVEDGRVAGVRVVVGSVPREYRARGGVILATGDFTGNAEMREHFLSPAAAAASPDQPPRFGRRPAPGHGTGRGHQGDGRHSRPAVAIPRTGPPGPSEPAADLALALHLRGRHRAPGADRLAEARGRSRCSSPGCRPRPRCSRRATILVNHEGNRFCDEPKGTGALAFQPEGKGFLIFDSKIAEHFDTPPNSISTAPGIAFATLQRLPAWPARPGAPGSADVAALAQAHRGRPRQPGEGGRADRGFVPPLWAMGPAYSKLTVSEGGLCLDDRMRVLRPDGSFIPGLYGAGGVAQSGMTLEGHGHHIAWMMTSGRLSGRDAVAQARSSA